MSTPDDAGRVRRASLAVGLFVGVASAITIAIGVAILLVVILVTGHHEDPRTHRPIGPPPFQQGDSFVVDVDHVLPWVVGLGIVGVALLAGVGWFAARRASRPLAEALELQRNFVADASHELRTPLTALSSRVQIVQRRQARDLPIDDALVALRRDTDAMTDVLNDLLITAEGTRPTLTEPTRLDHAAAEALETLTPMAAEADVHLALESDQSVVVDVPARTMTRLVIALVDNAIQHSPRGSTVDIEATSDSRTAQLRVVDHGGGIVGIDSARVFERFARSSEEGRPRSFGIGLSLVKNVAARYRGDVEVERSSPEGTVFRLTLPLSGRRAPGPAKAR
jgi:signal transduction histidine kinase